MGDKDSKKQPPKGRPQKERTKNAATVQTNTVACSVKVLRVPPRPGATVWAYFYNFAGSYQANPSSGWSHTIGNLHGLDELVDRLEKAGLRNRVAHLALVGHNEAPLVNKLAEGTVTFNAPIPGISVWVPTKGFGLEHYSALPTPPETFAKLAPYLQADAWLSLYICVSGKGPAGDKLLREVSETLPGRTIVAFTVYVMVGNGGAAEALPGNAAGTSNPYFLTSEPEFTPLTPWGKAAKRALNGKIIHIPMLEKQGVTTVVKDTKWSKQTRQDPPYRCANPCCPATHQNMQDDCEGY